MAIGKMPQNQLDALPLLTATDVTDPSETVVVGTSVVKTWDPSKTGVNGIAASGGGASLLYLLTAQMDFRGMNTAMLQLQRDTTVGGSLTEDVTCYCFADMLGLGGLPGTIAASPWKVNTSGAVPVLCTFSFVADVLSPLQISQRWATANGAGAVFPIGKPGPGGLISAKMAFVIVVGSNLSIWRLRIVAQT